VIDTFRESHPDTPVSMNTYITLDEWLSAVRTGDINRMALQRAATEVKVVETMDKRLTLTALRPEP
jgi:hypothetical protein